MIGIAKVLPGISGSLIAIRLNIYNDLVLVITSFFSNIKNNSIYISKIGLGFIFATIITSKLLYGFMNSYFVVFEILFILLIISGLPSIIKKASSLLAVFIITIIIYIIFIYLNSFIYNCPINYFVAGIIETISTIIPGVSGTAIYINLGWYDEILQMFGNLYMFEFCKIIPFCIGMFTTMLLLTNLIKILILKHERLFYSFISGFVISNLFLLFK